MGVQIVWGVQGHVGMFKFILGVLVQGLLQHSISLHLFLFTCTSLDIYIIYIHFFLETSVCPSVYLSICLSLHPVWERAGDVIRHSPRSLSWGLSVCFPREIGSQPGILPRRVFSLCQARGRAALGLTQGPQRRPAVAPSSHSDLEPGCLSEGGSGSSWSLTQKVFAFRGATTECKCRHCHKSKPPPNPSVFFLLWTCMGLKPCGLP